MSWQCTRDLARAATRELAWGLRHVSREVDRWRARATTIPDPQLRADALRAIDRKRGNINGAALFWTLPDRRTPDLLEVLIAYEILADFLDCVSERNCDLGIANGRQLHLALVEALDPTATMSNYYLHQRRHEDGGYLDALVHSCRAGCAKLPSYQQVRPVLARATELSQVLALNHERDPARRDRALKQWQPALHAPAGLSWFERTAGASAWLTVFALLALAAETSSAQRRLGDVEHTYEAYLHCIAPAGAMLDSFVDSAEDLANGDHRYIEHYPSMEQAVERVGELIRRSRREASSLPGGARHSVILSCMIAFYLSKDSARRPTTTSHASELRRAGGPLVAALLPVLRLWRVGYGQCSA